MKTFDDFCKKYTIVKKLETYGKDLEKVKKANKKNIFTIIEEDNKQYLVSGIAFVNRIQYVLIKEKFKSDNEIYLYVDFNEQEV